MNDLVATLLTGGVLSVPVICFVLLIVQSERDFRPLTGTIFARTYACTLYTIYLTLLGTNFQGPTGFWEFILVTLVGAAFVFLTFLEGNQEFLRVMLKSAIATITRRKVAQ